MNIPAKYGQTYGTNTYLHFRIQVNSHLANVNWRNVIIHMYVCVFMYIYIYLYYIYVYIQYYINMIYVYIYIYIITYMYTYSYIFTAHSQRFTRHLSLGAATRLEPYGRAVSSGLDGLLRARMLRRREC